MDFFSVFNEKPVEKKPSTEEKRKADDDPLELGERRKKLKTDSETAGEKIMIEEFIEKKDENELEKQESDEEMEAADDNDGKEKKSKKIEQEQRNHKLPYFEIEITKEDCGCVHETVSPKGFEKSTKIRSKPAKEYPFTLDPFQKKAIECIESNESVLVAAHTSAGKTAVAEYAIAMSFREKQRVIYTSPIKALSNQKYRELNDEFGDVGLVTGDVSINQGASCLVMTTEILRSMLYRGSEIIREVAWVIMDEVHYMRDKERGVVWEETIILLSPNVRYVFLSATIPNASEFAEWVCRIKNQPCHVVYTDFRPVPLQHYIFPSGGDGIHLVVDEFGRFKEDNFNKVLSSLEEGIDFSIVGQKNKKKKKPTEGADLNKILKMIMEKGLNPVIVFSFSKKDVEGYAMAMAKFDLTSEEEKEKIHRVFESATEVLSEEDKQLPQIQHMLPILKKGLGIHHGGLLPIVKEVIEILFQEGWIKVLFSTETFSMGLNMPARTVVFTSVRKFDGENFRWIGGGEYIQMSGRAGRRGIDSNGTTILMVDEKMEPEVAKGMLKGQADPLNSSFHLSYNMLLNSMRIEDTDPEYIIRRSFHQFQNDKALPEMKDKLKALEERRDSISIQNESKLSEIFGIEQQIKSYQDKVRKIMCEPKHMLPFLSIGRLVRIKKGEQDWGWGISINFTEKRASVKSKKSKGASGPESLYFVDVLVHIKPRQKNEEPVPAKLSEEGEMTVLPVLLECIYEVSSVRIMLPDDLTTKANKLTVKETLKEIEKQFQNWVPLLDPVKDMKVDSDELEKILERKKKLEERKKELMNATQLSSIEEELRRFEDKQKVTKTINALANQIDVSEKMVLDNDLKCMKRVLRRLDFIDKEDVVKMKGKVACEISACEEIIVTELMFSGVFREMEPNELAALLSALVHDEKNTSEKQPIKNEKLAKYFSMLIEHAKRIAKIYNESKINIDEAEYLGNFKPQMIEVVYAWGNGASFSEICKMSDTYEGSIIRCMRRLDELLKQLSSAAKTIGNSELMEKFDEASKKIKRGIVFAASLYL